MPNKIENVKDYLEREAENKREILLRRIGELRTNLKDYYEELEEGNICRMRNIAADSAVIMTEHESYAEKSRMASHVADCIEKEEAVDAQV